jgi:hypothetical protein
MPELPATVTTAALILVLAVLAYVLRRFGILFMSPTESAAVARANRAENELALANQRIGELEQSKSLKPILELLNSASQANAQVLERLASLNGALGRIDASLAETQEGLHVATEAIKLVAGLVVGATELHRLKPPQ